MFGPLIIGFVAIALISFLCLIESNEVNRLEKLFEIIKFDNGITKSDLNSKLGVDRKYYLDKDFISISDFWIEEKLKDYVYIKYSYMGHCIGQPVRFLQVFYDKDENFVKVKLDIGMSNTITKEYLKDDNLKIQS